MPVRSRAGAVVIDVFAPVREDWVALETAESREPRWPGYSGSQPST
jgi:hypothetical protein